MINETIPPKWLNHPDRGQLPHEFIFGVTSEGKPDDVEAEVLAHNAAAIAYELGFDVEVLPRIVGGERVPGGFVVRVTHPPQKPAP